MKKEIIVEDDRIGGEITKKEKFFNPYLNPINFPYTISFMENGKYIVEINEKCVSIAKVE